MGTLRGEMEQNQRPYGGKSNLVSSLRRNCIYILTDDQSESDSISTLTRSGGGLGSEYGAQCTVSFDFSREIVVFSWHFA